MLFPKLFRPSPGQKIRAQHVSDLADAVTQLREEARKPDGLIGSAIMARILAETPNEVMFPARIIAVNVGTPNPNSISGRPAYTPSTVTYDVRGIGRPGVDLTNLTPHYGRPTRYDDALIHPARVKDLCFLEHFLDSSTGEPVSRLFLLPGSEVIARKVCATSGGGGAPPDSSIVTDTGAALVTDTGATLIFGAAE